LLTGPCRARAGIDKPNIRRIIHYGAPATLEAYYQQARTLSLSLYKAPAHRHAAAVCVAVALHICVLGLTCYNGRQIGRAGRDGLPAKCLMLWSGQDWSKLDFIKVRSRADDVPPAWRLRDSGQLWQQAAACLSTTASSIANARPGAGQPSGIHHRARAAQGQERQSAAGSEQSCAGRERMQGFCYTAACRHAALVAHFEPGAAPYQSQACRCALAHMFKAASMCW